VLEVKLLVVGSVLVLFSVVGWAATNWTIDRVMTPHYVPPPPVYRFVNADGSGRTSVPVWQTSTGPTDCDVLVARLRREQSDPIAALMSSSETLSTPISPENVCALFQAGEAQRGAKVEVLDDCGHMARIRVLSGPLQGTQGCIQNELLTEAAPG